MASTQSKHFNYEGFIAEVERQMARYEYTCAFTAHCAGVDHSTLYLAIQRRTYGLTVIAAMGLFFQIPINNYLLEVSDDEGWESVPA